MSEEKGEILDLVRQNDALASIPDPQPQIVEELVRNVAGSSPQSLDKIIAEMRILEARASEVIDRATEDIQKVEAIVKQTDDEVAARNFRAQVYASVLTIAAIAAGLLGNVLGAAFAGAFGAFVRAEGAARIYIWHTRKKKIRELVEDASAQRKRWINHKQDLALARSKLEGNRLNAVRSSTEVEKSHIRGICRGARTYKGLWKEVGGYHAAASEVRSPYVNARN